MNGSDNNDNEPHQIKQFDADFYQAMIDTLQEGAFVVESKCFKLVNDAFCHLTGCSKSDLVGKQFDSFIYPQNNPIVFEDMPKESSITRLNNPIVRERIESNSPEYHLVVAHISGSSSAVEISSQHFIDAKGQLYQIANVRKKFVEQALNQALRESENSYHRLIEQLPNVYFQTNSSGSLTKASSHTAAILGYSNKELLGKSLSELYLNPSEQAETLARIIDNKGQLVDMEAFLVCKDRTSLKVNLSASAMYDKNREFIGIEAVAKKAPVRSTMLQAQESTIRDPLTRLVTRLAFAEHLSKSVRSARRHQSQLWVLYVSLQNLNDINGLFGDNVSDACLVNFSQRLQSFFRDTDIVARISDGHFAVLLDDYTNDLALDDLFARLQSVMDKKAKISQYPYGFTFNIGSANFPSDGISSDELIDHAESMMYKSKFSQDNVKKV